MYFSIETKDSPLYAQEGTGLSAEPHLHTHVELIYFLGGKSVCRADRTEQIATAGDIFIAFPNQIHSYRDIVRPPNYLLIFSPDICPDFSDIFRSGIPAEPVIRGADKSGRVKSILADIISEKGKDEPFYETRRRAELMLVLCEIFPKLKIEKSRHYDENTLKRIISYCYENYRSDISLSSAAESLGISEYYISHVFNCKLNMGFKEYINALRISDACRMLKEDKLTITEVALECGFSTCRTFNRCFMATVGKTPSGYRKSAR